VRIGTVWLDNQGRPVEPNQPPSAKPVDLKSLLGDDDGFYF
jgi:hypothetical protein